MIPLSLKRRWTTADAWAAGVRVRAAAHGIPVTCRKGCAFCCRSDVAATQPEIDAVPMTADLQTKLLVHPLARLADDIVDAIEMPTDAPRSLEVTAALRAPCPLLREDRTCGAYGLRPSICRTYLVVTPPERCDAANGDKEIQIVSPFGEVPDSAINHDQLFVVGLLKRAINARG